MPAPIPNSLRPVTASWRVTSTVSRKANIGDVELRIVASAASVVCCAQAMSVKGITLLRQA